MLNSGKKVVNILAVDDDYLFLQLIEHKLTQKGFCVKTAQDGETALSMAIAEPPALIILDGMMPGLDGKEVLRQLKSKPDTKHIPVVMLSARKMEHDVVAGLKLGADDYLVKPFMPEELLVRVNQILTRKGLL